MSLSNLKMSSDVEKEVDTLGGGGVLDTNIYDMNITAAFFGKSKGGAMSVTLYAETAQKQSFKNVQWVTSGNAKGNKPFYERDGKKYPLPGYSVINDICVHACGKELSDMETEETTVKIYDYDLKKEVPTEVDSLVDIVGNTISLAINKVHENKNVLNSEGKYVPTADTRDINDISKVFNSTSHLTVPEMTNGITEPEFYDKWLKKNKGVTRDKTDKSLVAQASPAKAKRPLFKA